MLRLREKWWRAGGWRCDTELIVVVVLVVEGWNSSTVYGNWLVPCACACACTCACIACIGMASAAAAAADGSEGGGCGCYQSRFCHGYQAEKIKYKKGEVSGASVEASLWNVVVHTQERWSSCQDGVVVVVVVVCVWCWRPLACLACPASLSSLSGLVLCLVWLPVH